MLEPGSATDAAGVSDATNIGDEATGAAGVAGDALLTGAEVVGIEEGGLVTGAGTSTGMADEAGG